MLIFPLPSCITDWRTSEKPLLYNETHHQKLDTACAEQLPNKMILLWKKLSLLGLKDSDYTH